MFYEGTLQEGISTAVGQQKLVLCFVTDESDESTQWENEFLVDDTLSDLLKEHSIALRLKARSEEAGYLAQIFPLPRTPTVVIIKNGELKEYITPGTSKEDFLRRVQTAFNSTAAPAAPATTQPTPAPEQASPPQSQAETPSASEQQSTPPTAAPSTSENVRRILAERAARLQAQKEENERKVKEERARTKEKAKAEAEAGMDTDNARAHKQAEAVRKKKQKDQEEKARILKRIEDDKAERRLRAEQREKQKLDNLKGGDVAASLVSAPETKLSSSSKSGAITALQVRLFDGSTLRNRFKTTAHLKEVRQWVDENRGDGSLPYTFKQVLTPLPNKNIDETEEDKPLGDLGLFPSSTLVLIPVKKFTTAYNGSQGIVSRVIAFILGIFTWIFSLFGGGDERTGPRGPTSDAPTSSQERVQSFQNRRDQQRDQQLYNGNSLNFEPRPEEEEKDE
ncbi:UBX7 UBX (ubiquitin regulatory X) domain-containing protein [Fusarium phyllophilum]|uniref:UBX domain-containing protein 2 n=1 Tax=Fusarium phyllophilum TaxID=47803 RepID=A0A8H5KAB5_9HYPO|nr:UBX7 UBX (ubiquitin regulatory X) domain-containing protein [Fusarium phyllophilum]